jgi:hypothetical protein
LLLLLGRTLHEAYQFLSWKYSKIRDITARNPDLSQRSTSEGGDSKDDKFKMAGLDEEDEEIEVDIVVPAPDISRPSSATGTSGSGKRIRRTKSAKASFAGRGGQIPKPIGTIDEGEPGGLLFNFSILNKVCQYTSVL